MPGRMRALFEHRFGGAAIQSSDQLVSIAKGLALVGQDEDAAALVTDQISASVLCPYFVPTGISQSHRNRPADATPAKPTRSQLIGQAMSDKAVGSGRVSAADVAQKVFDAIAAGQFYIYSHPKAIGSVQVRLEDIMLPRNPTDPFAHKPELGLELKRALRAA